MIILRASLPRGQGSSVETSRARYEFDEEPSDSVQFSRARSKEAKK